MKYEFTQQFAGYAAGEVKDAEVSIYVHNVPLPELERVGIVKKVKDKKKPKFKVGDYAVLTEEDRFIKVSNLCRTETYGFFYNGFKEDSLREPTKEELELYFR